MILIDMGSGLVMPFYSLFNYCDLGAGEFPDFIYPWLYGKKRGRRGIGEGLRYTAEGGEGFGAFEGGVFYEGSVSDHSEKIAPDYFLFPEFFHGNGRRCDSYTTIPLYAGEGTKAIGEIPAVSVLGDISDNAASKGIKYRFFETEREGSASVYSAASGGFGFENHRELRENFFGTGLRLGLSDGIETAVKITEIMAAHRISEDRFFSDTQAAAEERLGGFTEGIFAQEKLPKILSEISEGVLSEKTADMFTGNISEGGAVQIPEKMYTAGSADPMGTYEFDGLMVGGGLTSLVGEESMRYMSVTQERAGGFDLRGGTGQGGGIRVLSFLDGKRSGGREGAEKERETMPQSRENYDENSEGNALFGGRETDTDSLLDWLSAALAEAEENSCEGVHF